MGRLVEQIVDLVGWFFGTEGTICVCFLVEYG